MAAASITHTGPRTAAWILRGALVAGLAAIAVIHALDATGQWTDLRYLFWLYMGLIAVAAGLAVCAMRTRDPRVYLASALLAGAVMVGFVISRTVGLPGSPDDIGNWTEPLGVASMIAEAIVVVVGIAGMRLSGYAAARPAV